jgi:hypothetical protein
MSWLTGPLYQRKKSLIANNKENVLIATATSNYTIFNFVTKFRELSQICKTIINLYYMNTKCACLFLFFHVANSFI